MPRIYSYLEKQKELITKQASNLKRIKDSLVSGIIKQPI